VFLPSKPETYPVRTLPTNSLNAVSLDIPPDHRRSAVHGPVSQAERDHASARWTDIEIIGCNSGILTAMNAVKKARYLRKNIQNGRSPRIRPGTVSAKHSANIAQVPQTRPQGNRSGAACLLQKDSPQPNRRARICPPNQACPAWQQQPAHRILFTSWPPESYGWSTLATFDRSSSPSMKARGRVSGGAWCLVTAGRRALRQLLRWGLALYRPRSCAASDVHGRHWNSWKEATGAKNTNIPVYVAHATLEQVPLPARPLEQ